MKNETFSERLKRTIYTCAIQDNGFYFCISFTTLEEFYKYKRMYPNKKMSIINSSLLYDKAEDAIQPQKLNLVIKSGNK